MDSNNFRNISLYLTIICFILLPTCVNAQQDSGILSGHLWDKDSTTISDSVIITAQKDQKTYNTHSDRKGNFSFGRLPLGTYKLKIYSISYKAPETVVHLHKDQKLELVVEKVKRTLSEVYVTASESKGLTSSSVIDRKAMEHLQPSSFADLLELLPGGRAKDPVLTGMNQIKLREVGVSGSEYDITSLGTQFVIDGTPINTNANLQSASAFFLTDPNSSRNSVNKGVDMRTLSTNQIQKVEIIRGIPSVEYGDLTSGVVKMERIKGATPLTARMKADGFSKLFEAGKGFNLASKQMTINVDLSYLDAKQDPVNTFTNYKRIIGSFRVEKRWSNSHYLLTWNSAFDYSTNIDNQRTDPDNSYALTDNYKSTYNSYALSSGAKSEIIKLKSILKGWEVTGSVNYQHDKIDITQWTQARTATVLLNSLTAGEHDIPYLTPSYAANFIADGKPLTAFFKATADLRFNTSFFEHAVKLGIETNYSKNFGKGQLYDLNYPTSTTISTRPRTFDTIPGMLNQAAFIGDVITIRLGEHKIATSIGIRGQMLAGMDSRYDIANKMYFDPRVNAKWYLPKMWVHSKPFTITLGGGFGLQTKMPTIDMLHPTAQYLDIVQLNFFHNNPEFRKANAITYIIDKTNYALQPAVNRKFELNGDFNLNENRFSVTWFREKMTSGFRPAARYNSYTYKKYDPLSVDAASLEAAPQITDFSYIDARRLYATSIITNGSTLIKNGFEYSFTSRRLPVVNTRFSVNGAYFNSKYINTFPFYKINTDIAVNGNVAQYAGIYNDTDGYLREQFNTNIMTDSYLPKLGLTLSASIQNQWFSISQSTWRSGTPSRYVDINGNIYEFTEESKTDSKVNYLNEPISATAFNRYVVPIDLQLNIKATKNFKQKASVSMFVNRLLTYTPNYTSFGVLRRRSGFNTPYFGMELNFNF